MGLTGAGAVPAPNLAVAERTMDGASVAAVQPPLLAQAERTAAEGSSLLGLLPRNALPALLVVVASGVVAAVSGGQLRLWQLRRVASA